MSPADVAARGLDHIRAAALVAVAVLLPWESLHGSVALAGLTVTWLELALLAAAASAWLEVAVHAGRGLRRLNSLRQHPGSPSAGPLLAPPLAGPLLVAAIGTTLFLGGAVLSALLAPPLSGALSDVSASGVAPALKATARLGLDASVGLAALLWLRQPPSWLPERRFLGVIVASAVVAAGLGIAEQQWADGIWVEPLLGLFRPKATLLGGVRRLTGPLLHANVTASYLLLVIPLAWALAASRRAVAVPALIWPALIWPALIWRVLSWGVLVWALLGTYSRGAWLGLVAAAGLWFWRSSTYGRWLLVGLLLVIGLRLGVDPAARHRLGLSPQGPAVAYTLTALPPTTPGMDAVRLRNTGWLTWRPGGSDPIRLEAVLVQRAPPATAATPEIQATQALAITRRRLPHAVPPGGVVTLAIPRPSAGSFGDDTRAARAGTIVRWRLAQHGWRSFAPQSAIATPADPLDLAAELPAARRVNLWSTALRLWSARPLLGWGADTFRRRWPSRRPDLRPDRRMHANNLWLELLADLGLLGAMGLALVVVTAVARRATGSVVQRGAAAAVLAWGVHGAVDCFLFFHVSGALFWLCVALAIGPIGSVHHRGDAAEM